MSVRLPAAALMVTAAAAETETAAEAEPGEGGNMVSDCQAAVCVAGDSTQGQALSAVGSWSGGTKEPASCRLGERAGFKRRQWR